MLKLNISGNVFVVNKPLASEGPAHRDGQWLELSDPQIAVTLPVLPHALPCPVRTLPGPV